MFFGFFAFLTTQATSNHIQPSTHPATAPAPPLLSLHVASLGSALARALARPTGPQHLAEESRGEDGADHRQEDRGARGDHRQAQVAAVLNGSARDSEP